MGRLDGWRNNKKRPAIGFITAEHGTSKGEGGAMKGKSVGVLHQFNQQAGKAKNCLPR